MMNFNELSREAYSIAVKHGWHETKYSDQHFLTLVMCELAEAVEADRANRHADINAFEHDMMNIEKYLYGEDLRIYECNAFNNYIKDTVEDELADVIIRSLDLAGLKCCTIRNCIYPGSEFEFMSFTEFCFEVMDCIVSNFQTEGLGTVIENTIALVESYSMYKDINIEWHVQHKMQFNKSRAYKHGKNY